MGLIQRSSIYYGFQHLLRKRKKNFYLNVGISYAYLVEFLSWNWRKKDACICNMLSCCKMFIYLTLEYFDSNLFLSSVKRLWKKKDCNETDLSWHGNEHLERIEIIWATRIIKFRIKTPGQNDIWVFQFQTIH